MRRAIFFDRDGVLNEEVGYLWEVEKFIWVDGAREAIKFCNDNDLLTVVVTNQSGIARGLYTEREVDKIHAFMQRSLAKIGAHIDAFYHCPHHPEFSGECDCRKPKPGMILKACAELGIDPAQSILFGDSKRDLDAAQAAGLRAGISFTSENNLLDVVKLSVKKFLHVDGKE